MLFHIFNADTQENARRIALAVTVQYDDAKPTIVTIEDAIAKESFFTDPDSNIHVEVGDAKSESTQSFHANVYFT